MSQNRSWSLGAWLALSAALAGLAPAYAADDVIITARIPTPQADTPSDVTVITAADIAAKQASSVLDALRGAPGVSLSQNGGPGQTATVRLRGGSADQTLVLIDGVPVNDPSSPSGYNFAYLDSGVVQRIEVLRGAGSAIWGSDALGGVINIVTFEPGKTGASAYAEGGAYSTGRIGARASYAAGPLTLSGYGTAFRTGGISSADKIFGNTEPDGANNKTLSGRAALALGGGFTAAFGVRTTQGEADFDDGPSHLGAGIADSSAVAHSREGLADANLSWRSDRGRFGVSASASRSLTKTDSDSPDPFSDFAARGERTQERITADARIAPSQIVLIGAEHEELEILTRGSLPFSASSRSSAGFATYDGRFFDKLQIEGGVRHEHDSRFGDVTTGRIGAGLDVWRGGTLKATIGNAFKAPSVSQSTGGGFADPNPNLKPEKSTEWEIGGEQKLFGGAARIGLVYFDRNVKDLITFGTTSYINLPRSDSKGVEVTGAARLGRVDVNGSYTHDKATDRTSEAQLLRVPEDQAALDLSWRATGALTLGAGAIWNGKENDISFDGFTFSSAPVINPSWTRIDLRASYQVNDQVQLYGRIENVADEAYESVYGYGAPGRSAYIGIRVKS